MSSTPRHEENNVLNIPDILAGFFLRKFEMPNRSNKSDNELGEKRRKAKHKKRKHKKHKHKNSSSSRDHSIEKDSSRNEMALLKDRSDSEEREIKRLKKIKKMEVRDVNKLCIATSKNSAILQDNIQYGPSIELLLNGVECQGISSHSSLLATESSSPVTSQPKFLNLENCQESILVSNKNTSKCISHSHDIILDPSPVSLKKCNSPIPCKLKSEKCEVEQHVSFVTDGANCENCIYVKETDLNFCKDENQKMNEKVVNVIKEDINMLSGKQEDDSKNKILSSDCEKSDNYSFLSAKCEKDDGNKKLSHSKSLSSKFHSHGSRSRSKTLSPAPHSSDVGNNIPFPSNSVTRDQTRKHIEMSRNYSVSRSRSRSKGKRLSRSKSKDNLITKHRRNSSSRSRSSSNSVSDVSHSKLDKEHKFSRTKYLRKSTSFQSKKHKDMKCSSRKYSRSTSRSSSRSRSFYRSRSNEKFRLKHKRSRSRSRSFDLHKKSRSRSKSYSRKSSKSRKYRSKSGKRLQSRSRSRSYSETKRKSHHKDSSGSRAKNSHSPSLSCPSQKSPSNSVQLSPKTKEKIKSTLSQSDKKIDQAKILEIARKNVLSMIEKGTLPEGLSLEKFKKEQLVSIKAGGKSVQELTDFCVQLSKKENDPHNETEDKNGEDTDNGDSGFIHHPFKLKEPSMIRLNIKNAIQVPVRTHAEKVAETARLSSQFPVSSGNQHKQKELEWIPVEPNKTKVVQKVEMKSQNYENSVTEMEKSSLELVPQSDPPVAVCYPYIPSATDINIGVLNPSLISTSPLPLLPPPPPLPPSDFPFMPSIQPEQPNICASNIPMQPTVSVFKPSKPLDISSIVTMRFKALTKLQANPNDEEALNTLNQAQESIQQWVQSQQVPGLFTGSTDAKLLSVEELCGPKNYRVKRDIFTRAAPVTEGKGMSLLKKMGWNPGEGLGKNKEGSLEPLVLDIKTDKKGLVSEGEGAKKNMAATQDLQGKHPVSALMELCSKRKWKPPLYTVVKDVGPPHKKLFIFKVEVNGIEYQPITPCSNKKQAKADSAIICLQSLNVFPKND